MPSCRHSTWPRNSECSSTTSHKMDRYHQIRWNYMPCSISLKNSPGRNFSSFSRINLSILNWSCLNHLEAATCNRMQRSSAESILKYWQRNYKEATIKKWRSCWGRNCRRSSGARNVNPWRSKKKACSIWSSLFSRASRRSICLGSSKTTSSLRISRARTG